MLVGLLVCPLMADWWTCWKRLVELTVPPGVAGGVKDGDSRDAGTPGITSLWSFSVLLLSGLALSGCSSRFLSVVSRGRTGSRALRGASWTAWVDVCGACGEAVGEAWDGRLAILVKREGETNNGKEEYQLKMIEVGGGKDGKRKTKEKIGEKIGRRGERIKAEGNQQGRDADTYTSSNRAEASD